MEKDLSKTPDKENRYSVFIRFVVGGLRTSSSITYRMQAGPV